MFLDIVWWLLFNLYELSSDFQSPYKAMLRLKMFSMESVGVD